ncbi:MAG: hypothetical protein ACRC0V_11630 [Fusobacteriaceae bacterium]
MKTKLEEMRSEIITIYTCYDENDEDFKNMSDELDDVYDFDM